jgi:hypothetical protein
VTPDLAMLSRMENNLQGMIFGAATRNCDIPQLLSMSKAGERNLDDNHPASTSWGNSTMATRPAAWQDIASSSAIPTTIGGSYGAGTRRRSACHVRLMDPRTLTRMPTWPCRPGRCLGY